MRDDDWRKDGAPDDNLLIDLDMAKASDGVSSPENKRYGLKVRGKTVGGKDLKPSGKKLSQAHRQMSGNQGIGSYDSRGNPMAQTPGLKRVSSINGVSSGKVAKSAVQRKTFFAEKQKRPIPPKQGCSQAQRSMNSRYPSLKITHGRGNFTGGERSAAGEKQPEHEGNGQGGTGGGKSSPLTRHPGNGSPSRKPAARIIPGSSLGCRSDSNTAGTISRSAGGVRTKSDISRTRENAKERAKQAAQEQEERSRWGHLGNSDGRQGARPSINRTYGKSTFSSTLAAERRDVRPSSSKRELVTVDDSSSDEETEEEVEEKLEFDSIHRDVDEGNPADDGQSSEFPPQGGGVDDRKDGDAKTESRNSMFGTIPEFDADAVMVGSNVVSSACHMKITMNGQITLSLKIEGECPKDTTLDIPEGEITFFGFSKARERSSKALVAIRTRAAGKVAKDPRYRHKYDPVDKGPAGVITVFLPHDNTFQDHAETILDVLTTTREGGKLEEIAVELDMTGELPEILRRTLENQNAVEEEEGQDLGRVRTRRARRAGGGGGGEDEASKVLLQYPPEFSANDRVAITVLDEARTQEGEFLNDSLVDLYLKHMHREAFRSWKPKASGESMDGERVHIFTSHFFTKLTENSSDSFSVAYKKVQHWSRNVDLFSKKFVFFPVVDNLHWSLACVANLDKLEVGKDKSMFEPEEDFPCMIFMDSLNMHQPSRIYNYLSRYLAEKWRETRRGDIILNKRTFPLVLPDVPTQINGCDCGLYVLRYAKEICQQWPQVTSTHVKDRLAEYFKPELFSPHDIMMERRELKKLLVECKIRCDEEKEQRQQREKSNKFKGKESIVRGSGKGEEGGGAGAEVITSVAMSGPPSEAAVATSSDTSAVKPVTADGETLTEELQDDMYCTIMEGGETQEEPGGVSKGLEVEVGDTEREPGIHAPVRKKKRLQPANWTFATTTQAAKGEEGSVEYRSRGRCETGEVEKGQGVPAECSVQQPGGEGLVMREVSSCSRVDAVSGGSAGPSSIGHKAKGTSPVRRGRYAKSPPRNGDESCDTITGQVSEVFVNEGVPSTNVELQMQRPINSRAQPEFNSDSRAAEAFRLVDEADSYKVKGKTVKSASSQILSLFTPAVSVADETSPRQERDITVDDLREGARVKEGKDGVPVGIEHKPLMGKEQRANVLRSEEYLSEIALQGESSGVGSEMTDLTANTTPYSLATSLSLPADGNGPTTVQNTDREDMFLLETPAHATSSRLSTPEDGNDKGCGIRKGGVKNVESCGIGLQQEFNVSIAERLKAERLEGGRGGDTTLPRGRRKPPSSFTVPSSPNGTSPGSRRKQKLDPSTKEVEVVESRDYAGVMTGQGRGGAVKRQVACGPARGQGKKIRIEECNRDKMGGKARGEGKKGAGSRGKRSTKSWRVNVVLSDSGEETVSDYGDAQNNVAKGVLDGVDLSDKDEEWTHADG